MKKLLKLSLILFIVIACFMNVSAFAVEGDNISNANNTGSANNVVASSQVASDTVASSTNSTSSSNSSTKSSTQVTSVASVDESSLSLSDILNILLIATGIVLILLAIAIIIKLK